MPRNDSMPVITSPFESHKNEVPITLVLDAEDAIKVTVLERPDSSQDIRQVLSSFGRACHEFRPLKHVEENVNVWDDVASGKALWQNAEVLRWTVLVEGVDRIWTHQLVRQRIGITFSQQCTGDRDCRHDDIVIPRSYNQERWKTEQDPYIDAILASKKSYASAIDSGMCIVEARRILPQSSTSFIYMHVCLATLAALVRKRRDVMTQDWSTYVGMGKVRDAIVEASPWAAVALQDPRAAGSWYDKVKMNGWSCTHIWAPSGDYDNWDWNPDTFIHGDQTHEQVSSGPPVEPRIYIGETLVATGLTGCMNLCKRNGYSSHLSRLEEIYLTQK